MRYDRDIRSAIQSDLQQLKRKISRDRNRTFAQGEGRRRLARAVEAIQGRINYLRQHWQDDD